MPRARRPAAGIIHRKQNRKQFRKQNKMEPALRWKTGGEGNGGGRKQNRKLLKTTKITPPKHKNRERKQQIRVETKKKHPLALALALVLPSLPPPSVPVPVPSSPVPVPVPSPPRHLPFSSASPRRTRGGPSSSPCLLHLSRPPVPYPPCARQARGRRSAAPGPTDPRH